MDKRGDNQAAIDAINAGRDVPILARQVKYLNNIVEQDHRHLAGDQTNAQLQIVPICGSVIAGIERMPMIRQGELAAHDASPMPFADKFYALSGQVRPV